MFAEVVYKGVVPLNRFVQTGCPLITPTKTSGALMASQEGATTLNVPKRRGPSRAWPNMYHQRWRLTVMTTCCRHHHHKRESETCGVTDGSKVQQKVPQQRKVPPARPSTAHTIFIQWDCRGLLRSVDDRNDLLEAQEHVGVSIQGTCFNSTHASPFSCYNV